MKIYVFKTLGFILLALCTIGNLQAQNIDENSYQLTLTYLVDGEERQAVIEPGESSLATADLMMSYNTQFKVGYKLLAVSLMAKQQIELLDFNLQAKYNYGPVQSIFANGYQCWTNSYEFEINEKMKRLAGIADGIAKYYGDYLLYDYPEKKGIIHGWTYAYTNQGNQIHLVGSVDESSGYTLIQYNLKDSIINISKDCKGKVLDPMEQYQLLQLYQNTDTEKAVFDGYATAMSQSMAQIIMQKGMGAQNEKPAPALGWTSWYHYFHDIDEAIILENLNAFKSRDIPLQLFQIDDGYQESVGVWTQANDKFPNGMKPIADSIHAAGFKAGIWIAPFIVEKDSRVVEENPHWVVKDAKGKPLKVGLNPGWSGAYYALDIYNLEVRQYLRHTLDTIFNVWGYDMIKTDFLFAAAINPPKGKTHGEVMMDGMLLLREWTGDKLILGCGVPLGPSMNLVDYCRVSSDIHMKWEQRLLKALHMRERLSSWNATTTTIGRRQLTGRFFRNDPDVYVLRDEKNKLKPAQKHTMFFVNNLFGELVFTSDNINNYTAEQMQLYLSGFPYLKKDLLGVQRNGNQYTASFKIDEREYISYINLGKKKMQVTLPKGEYFNSVTGSFVSGEITLGAFETVCFYKVQKGLLELELLGSTGYLFPGAEVESLELVNDKNIKFTYKTGVQQSGTLYMRVPPSLKIEKVNGKPCTLTETPHGTLLVVQFD